MKHNKKITGLLCCLLCLCLCLAACSKEDASSVPTTQEPMDAIYTIHVSTAGGMIFEGLVIYVYEDNTEEELLTYGTLDANGSYTFTAPESDQYTVRFMKFPEEGYDLQEYYPITGTTTNIVLTSSVIKGQDALEQGKTYQVGNVMRDFTVSTIDGQELTLSKILEEKEAVVLNFWYTDCNPCKSEFPLLQAAYEAYSDKIEVITMNPTDISGDDAEKIAQFRDEYGLTMPMATCSSKWFSVLGVNSYPTTVIIDRYGVVCLLEIGAVEDAGVFEAAFEHFSATDYQQKLLSGFSDLHVAEYPVGDPKNPFQANGGMEEFEITVAGQSEFHVALFRGDGLILQLQDPNAYLIIGDERYEPNSKGIIEVKIVNPDVTTSTNLIVGNTGVTEATFKIVLLRPKGTFTNPLAAELGEINVTVQDGNEQGVYYSWTAEVEGVLTITISEATSEAYDVQLYNLNTYAVRTLQELVLVDEAGNRYVSIEVHPGDVVSIGYMSVPDASYNYWEVSFKAALTFKEGIEVQPNYTITVVDGEGNPMPGVTISVSGDGVNTTFVSDETGLIAMHLPFSIYTVKVTVPEGYVCDTTQFLLTDGNPHKEVVMTLYVPKEVPYTVYVVDDQGNPVQGAAVVLGDSFVYTDAAGAASVILLESKDYVATVVPPDGYYIENSNYPFGSNTVITVTVYPVPDVTQELDYTVQVVDGEGKPVTGLLVRFENEDGSEPVTQTVDGSGKATVRLPEGYYNVTVVFNAGSDLGYEPTGNTLTPSNTSLTIEVAPYVNGAMEMLFVNGMDYEAYNVSAGLTYVELTGTDIRFFLFTPEETGVYTFTTTNPAAAIGYWSTSFYAFNCSADYVKDNVCTLEVKAVGPTYVISVSGGEGITGTVLKIVRTGDVQENPVVYENYKGTSTPTVPYVAEVSGSKTYLNLATQQTLVKGDDGLYHLGSADGPVVYMDLKGTRYGISISAVVNNSAMVKYEFDENGTPIKRIDYTNCMLSYVNNADATHGVYALTDDLITIMQNHGNHACWYDSTSPAYLFGADAVLDGQGWMFLLCTFQ